MEANEPMKLVCLNTWGGRAGVDKLLAFLESHRDAGFICLQEVWSAPYEGLEGVPAGADAIAHAEIMVYGRQEISALLEGHAAFFHPNHLNDYGLMILVSKALRVVESGDVFVHRERGYVPVGNLGLHARNLQFVTVEGLSGLFSVVNFHGLWNGQGKDDSAERIAQSRRILKFLEGRREPLILCGDFNLLPDTESLRMLASAGLRNLVAESAVTSTRTSLYTRPDPFADYVFVSEGIDVRDFRVLPEEVSDHAPLLLEFA
jgi:endonuclease/exonuclease/phosphatase family metal-dependent hydrolase